MFEIRPYNHRNHVSNYNPFRDMENFEKSFFENPFGFFTDGALSEFKTDISDTGDSFVLETDLPGFAKEDIKLDINGDTLTIRAERHLEHEQKDKKNKYIRCERSYGSYSREFDISMIKTDEIKAKYDNGVLSLTLPKKENIVPNSRHLEIE
ncbi:MAG: Hsp20/alpha crystallin family protein [Clostridia bacterium]|nr:Hsp20/alpha crystallin family protein [Clostridia bacterium]